MHQHAQGQQVLQRRHRALVQETKRGVSGNVSLLRKGWPVQSTSPPEEVSQADGWTVVLDKVLQGWEVADVLEIFEAQDSFFQDWHQSLGDTCALPP